jgi:hypothetical protein
VVAAGGRWRGEQLLEPSFVRWSTTPVELDGEDEGTRRTGGSTGGRTAASATRSCRPTRSGRPGTTASGSSSCRQPAWSSCGSGFDPSLEGEELGVEELVADVVEVLGRP